MKSCIKTPVFAAGAMCGLFAAARLATRDALRIFTFHGVEAGMDPVVNFDRLQIEPALFARQVEWIASRYHILGGMEFIAALTARTRWPRGSALITFDDGYRNNLEVAAPILRRLGVPSVVFVTSGFIDGSARPWWYRLRKALGGRGDRKLERIIEEERRLMTSTRRIQDASVNDMERRYAGTTVNSEPDIDFPRFLSPEQLGGLRKYGMDIALHGDAHLACGVESEDDIVADILRGRDKLAGWGVDPLPLLAYPYGSMPRDMSSLASRLESAGIKGGLTTTMGINSREADQWLLRRFDVNGGRSVLNLAAVSCGLFKQPRVTAAMGMAAS